MSNYSEKAANHPDLILRLIDLEINVIRAHVQIASEAKKRGDLDRATEALSRGSSTYSRVQQMLVHVPPKDKSALVASLQVLGTSLT